jgi:hypothetical protein
MEDVEQHNIILCHFCAQYLPDLVAHYLDPPIMTGTPQSVADFRYWNAYLMMLVEIRYTPYFTKYLRSGEPVALKGKLLPRVLAERMLDRAPRWDGLILRQPAPSLCVDILLASLELLSVLLASFVKEPDQEKVVPRATRRALLPWLQKWIRRYPPRNISGHTGLGDVCLRVWAQMSEEMDFTKAVMNVRKGFQNLEICALPSCDLKSNNKACSKYVRFSSLASSVLSYPLDVKPSAM